MPLGTRYHACMEQYYQPASDGRPSTDDILAYHDNLVTSALTMFPEQAEDIQADGELSRIMLEGYFQWVEETGADEGLIVVEPERELEYPLTDDVTIQGKIDVRLVREVDGAKLLLDHKTYKEFTTPVRGLARDEQMRMYVLLERLCSSADERIDGAIYNMARKTKRTVRATPPFYRRVEISYNDHVLRDFYVRLMQEVADIMELERSYRAGETWRAYPSPSRDCSWKCPFVGVCALMDDESTNAEGLIESLYIEHDPYERYESKGSDDDE